MNIKKSKGHGMLEEMADAEPESFNSFLDGIEDDEPTSTPTAKPRTTTDSELLSMILMELKKISTALAAGGGGSVKKKGNNYKQGSDGAEEYTVKAKIAEWEDKGKFLRVKIATKPVTWASCWDESVAETLVNANENDETLTIVLKKKSDYTNVMSAE